MKASIDKYIKAFKKLRIDRSHGVAPHKPILLLSVLQSVQNDLIKTNCVYITPELVALFKSNWSLLVTTNHDCRISYPFYYLKSENFWRLVPKFGFENLNQIGSIMKSFHNLNAAVECAVLDEELFRIMQDKTSNDILIRYLLEEYFPNTKDLFSESWSGKQKIFENIENKIVRENSVLYKNETMQLILKKSEEEIYLRSSIFKREVPKIYNYTCCISSMKVDSIGTISMIDACHIVPFSESFDDTISNGISLCPNLHRAFDRGLISIDENYRVLVNSNWSELKSSYSIRQFEGKQIQLPNRIDQYPSLQNFQLHRERFKFR